MKRLIAAAVIAIAALASASVPASAESRVCHSITVNVNGESVVDDEACNTIPLP